MPNQESENEKRIHLKLHHIAYAVKSTDEAIEQFKVIYPEVHLYKCLEKSQNVYITYLSNKDENYKIELVEGVGSPNPVENMLKTRDFALYHLCYLVNDFKKAIEYFKKKKFLMITSPFECATEKGMWACHFFNSKLGIIEITGLIDHE